LIDWTSSEQYFGYHTFISRTNLPTKYRSLGEKVVLEWDLRQIRCFCLFTRKRESI